MSTPKISPTINRDLAYKASLLGYPKIEEGICFGVANMAMQSILLTDFDKFSQILSKILNTPHDRFSELTELPEDRLDTLAFFDGMTLHQNPAYFPAIFKPGERSKQDTLTTMPIVQSKKLEEQRGVVKLSTFSGAYDQLELKRFLQTLDTDLASIHIPFCLLLIANKHALCIGYIPDSEQPWILVDANIAPAMVYTSVSAIELAPAISLGFSTSENLFTTFFGYLYCLASHKSKAVSSVSTWDHTISFPVTSEKAQLTKWLLYAIQIKDHDKVKELLTAGADPSMSYSGSETAISLALEAPDSTILKYLLAKKPDVDFKLRKRLTALYVATTRNRVDLIEELLIAKADPDFKDCYGQTPLFVAIEFGYLDIVKLLLKFKANPRLGNREGLLPLSAAAKKNHSDIIKTLVKADQTLVSDTHPQTKETALHIAIKYGHLEALLVLLDHGANLNDTLSDGRTSLHLAIQYNRDKIISELLESGANPNESFAPWDPPLCFAIKNNFTRAAIALLLAGAEVNILSVDGKTPLGIATAMGNEKVIEELTKRDAQLTVATSLRLKIH